MAHGSHPHGTVPAKDVCPCAKHTRGKHRGLGTPVRSKVGRDGEQGFGMGTQTPALLLCMAGLRCNSKKGPVQARRLAWHENREAQLAAPPLPLLSIPGCIFCWPGQMRWILGPTPVPGLKPRLPGQALSLAALLGLLVPHSTGTAIWHLDCAASGGDGSVWGISGQGAGVAVGISWAPSWCMGWERSHSPLGG